MRLLSLLLSLAMLGVATSPSPRFWSEETGVVALGAPITGNAADMHLTTQLGFVVPSAADRRLFARLARDRTVLPKASLVSEGDGLRWTLWHVRVISLSDVPYKNSVRILFERAHLTCGAPTCPKYQP